DREIARQQSIFDALPLLADLLRSDVLYYDGVHRAHLVVAVHAQPHTAASLYAENRKDQAQASDKQSLLARAGKYGTREEGVVNWLDNGAAPIHQEVLPLRDDLGAVMGLLSIETAHVEYLSYRNRGTQYHRALKVLKDMVARGALGGVASLSPFTARDGLVIVGRDMRIRYVSNIAEGLYGKFGIAHKLIGERIDALETGDEQLIWQALHERQCYEREDAVRDAVWIRKAIPLWSTSPPPARPRGWLTLMGGLPTARYVLLLISDVTLERHKAQDQIRLETMIKEIHHRVKNNLQTIISLARVEARRAQSAETKRALEELTNRIFAVAQVHEFLSADNSGVIQLKEVSRQIAKQVRDSLLPTDARISIEVEGDSVRLPPRQATACALIVNELVQNAVEHAFADGVGYIRIQLEDSPTRVRIAVVDNGRGLPVGFDWRRSQSLGLKIVHTLVHDLHGELTLSNQTGSAHGLVAQITLSRMLSGGK
ncbi:MAG: sensor histidine kinase, partial [Chloroflexota bacterium]